MKKSLREKISNILNAQKLADEVDELDKQILSMRNQIESLKAKIKFVTKEKEVLEENAEKYITTIREMRAKKNGRKSI